MKQKIVLIGGGGHAKVIIDAIHRANEFNIYGIIDKKDARVMNIPFIGSDDDLPKIYKNVKNAFIAIGSIGDCSIRKSIYCKLKKIGFNLPPVVHPSAVIANEVVLGEGSFVAAGAVINPGVKIGKNAIINTSSLVDHDCFVGDFVHIAPGAALSGGVKIGNDTHVGTGACIIQNITIGRGCMIGAGATIRHNMAAGTKTYGQHVRDMQEAG